MSILSGVGVYFLMDSRITPVYYSSSQIYVITGSESESSLRASDGGLRDDFGYVFKGKDVIYSAQRSLGTSEDLAGYITVKTPPNSNVVEVICKNPDQLTAKKYVDAVVNSAVKNATLIPAQSMTVISEGTIDNTPVKPNFIKYTVALALAASFLWFMVELIIALIIMAFKDNDSEDDEADYYRNFIRNEAVLYAQNLPEQVKTDVEKKEIKKQSKKEEKERRMAEDFLSDYDDDDDFSEIEEDIMEIDVLSDIEEEHIKKKKKPKSSSAVIGRIPL